MEDLSKTGNNIEKEPKEKDEDFEDDEFGEESYD